MSADPCARCRETISDSLAGAADETAAAEAHLESCDACQAAVRDLVWQDLAIAEMAGREAKREILSRLHASLPSRRPWAKIALVAAAAGILAAILLFRDTPPPSETARRVTPAPIPKPPAHEISKPVPAPTPQPEPELESPPKPIPRAPDPQPAPPVPVPERPDAPPPPVVDPPAAPRPPTVPAIARLTKLGGEGRDLLEGQPLEVAARSTVAFPDGTHLELHRNTSLSRLSAADGKRVAIHKGTVTAHVSPQPKASPMVFTTPHGEAVITGTDLRISVGADTRVDVHKGEVRVKRDTRTLVLSGGQTTTIAEGKPFASRKLLPPLEELSSQLAPASWAEFETEGFDAPATLIKPWWPLLMDVEEAKWDPVQRQLHLLSYAAKEETHYWTYDERTNAWERRPAPVGESWFGPAYDHVAFDPVARALFFRQHNHDLVHQLDLRTNAWSSLPRLPENPGQVGALEFFPEMGGLVLACGGAVYVYRFKSKKWDVVAKGIEFGPSDAFLEYDPVHRVMLLGGGTGSRKLYRLDPSGAVTALRDAPLGLGLKDALVVVEPAGGRLLALSRPDAKSFHEYDVAQNRWTALEPPSVPVMRSTRGAHTAAAPIPGEGIVLFLFADEQSAAVYAYRRK